MKVGDDGDSNSLQIFMINRWLLHPRARLAITSRSGDRVKDLGESPTDKDQQVPLPPRTSSSATTTCLDMQSDCGSQITSPENRPFGDCNDVGFRSCASAAY